VQATVGLDMNAFLEAYYLMIVKEAFVILQDTMHKFAFEEEVGLLSVLLSIQNPNLNPEVIALQILDLFPRRAPVEILEWVTEMVRLSNNKLQLRTILKDFLVVVRQFAKMDPALNVMEMQAAQQTVDDVLRGIQTCDEGDEH
jgi:hypothetical protein